MEFSFKKCKTEDSRFLEIKWKGFKTRRLYRRDWRSHQKQSWHHDAH